VTAIPQIIRDRPAQAGIRAWMLSLPIQQHGMCSTCLTVQFVAGRRRKHLHCEHCYSGPGART